MDKLDIIQKRSFGDKFNELTSFISDNLSTLMKWSLMSVLPAACLMSYLLLDIGNQTNAVRILYISICIAILSAFGVVLVTILKHIFEEGIELKAFPFKSHIAEILRNLGAGMSLSLPFILFATFIAFQTKGIAEASSNELGSYILIIFYCWLVDFFFIPIFYTINAVVLEQKSGFEAIQRAFQLMLNNPIKVLLFLFVMNVILYIFPSLLLIPIFIINIFKELFINGNITYASDSLYQCIRLVFYSLFAYSVLLSGLMTFVGMLFEYGNAIEKVDNVSFMKKFNNFENL